MYVVESNPLTPAFYSRYSHGHFRWSLEEHSPEESVSFLRSIGQKLGRGTLLLPTSDQGAIFLAENRAALSQWFRFPRQSPELAKSLCSKQVMYGLASKFRVPIPETRFPTTRTEVVDFAATSTFPVLLKAIDGDRMFKLSRKRLFIAHSTDELLRKYDEINDPQNVMLQDYIPGPEDNCWIFHAYFNEKSECVAAFTGNKLRQFRAYGGHTCLGVSAKNPVIEETATRFLREIGYSGLVDICIRYDARDGLFKVLDINPRIGANSRLFVSASGLDLARIYYLDMTGQHCVSESVREGRKWIVESDDVMSCLRYWRDGNLGFREWISSLRGIDEFGYLRLNDPLPVVARLAYGLAEAARRIKDPVTVAEPLTSEQEASAEEVESKVA